MPRFIFTVPVMTSDELAHEFNVSLIQWGAKSAQIRNRAPGFFLSQSGGYGGVKTKYEINNNQLKYEHNTTTTTTLRGQ